LEETDFFAKNVDELPWKQTSDPSGKELHKNQRKGGEGEGITELSVTSGCIFSFCCLKQVTPTEFTVSRLGEKHYRTNI